MQPKKDMKCPYCGGQEFEVQDLGNPATTWKVTFGSQFFKKKELHACACKQCGFVSLFVETAAVPTAGHE
jgi:predicted nucleic-acid-binding Zn-ribbon protein